MPAPDPGAWPLPASSDADLPPLPTLAPLPRLRPLEPMPLPPWEDDPETRRGFGEAAWPVNAARERPAPPPPSGHPAAGRLAGSAPAAAWAPHSGLPGEAPGASWPVTAAAAGSASIAEAAGFGGAAEFGGAERLGSKASPGEPVASAWPVANARHDESGGVGAGPERRHLGDTAAAAAPAIAVDTAPARSGRHATLPALSDDPELPLAPGLRVLVIGGAEPLGGMVAERLIAAGHRLAVNGVTIPAELPRAEGAGPSAFRLAAPATLTGDRVDAEDVVHTVARAEVVLGGLDAIVVLPAHHSAGVGLDADASAWADEWSLALTTEVLAAACAMHIAARSFLARRKAGRIVLVTNGRDGGLTGALPASATRAALGTLGADLTRELGPHGIGVSVVTTGSGGTQDFAVAQVADVVEALLSTPVLSGVSASIG